MNGFQKTNKEIADLVKTITGRHIKGAVFMLVLVVVGTGLATAIAKVVMYLETNMVLSLTVVIIGAFSAASVLIYATKVFEHYNKEDET